MTEYVFCVVCLNSINGCACSTPRPASLFPRDNKPPIAKQDHWNIARRQNQYDLSLYCWICGYGFRDDILLGPLSKTKDHVIPKSKGGSNAWSNIRAAHNRCNQIRKTKDVTPQLIRICKMAIQTISTKKYGSS